MLQPVDHLKVLITVNLQTLERISGQVLQRSLLTKKKGIFTAGIHYSTVFVFFVRVLNSFLRSLLLLLLLLLLLFYGASIIG